MKYQIKKKISIDFTLDSSEMIMFTKGGKHTCLISPTILREQLDSCYRDEDDDKEYIDVIVEFSVQMERSEQGRFDFITEKQEWRSE